ncbi:MAG: C-terminal binding protein [Bacillota bacterium]|nr:C-terminal binding protein [Bacillota bacterium]MDI7249124.1 C-terminal binding protein [Bacillota bacterium]
MVTDHVFPSLETERRKLAEIGADLIEAPGTSEEEIVGAARDADGMLVCYAEITRKVIESLEKCRVIGRYGIGVNNIDLEAATEKGIQVANVPDYCVDEVSDHALALLLACARKIPQLDRTVKEGRWDFREQRPMFRVRGRTLGLVGFGKIARALAHKAQALGFKVVAYDPYVAEDEARARGVALVGLQELLSTADFVSVHAPLTRETRGLLGERELSWMKPTAYVINTARAEVVDEGALRRALVEGRIAGAALDVLAGERSDTGDPLVAMDRVILTPHCAFYSEESLQELQLRAVEEVVRGLKGEPLRSLVNREVLGR